MKLQTAYSIAEEIIHALHHDCIKIQEAGSVRRQKPEVRDIEIVYISCTIHTYDLFATLTQTHFNTDTGLTYLINDGILAKDTAVKRWGPKYKRAIHCASGIVIELFRAETVNWGYILALRTGPADFNKLLVTKRAFGGALPPDIELRHGYVWYDKQQISVTTEHAFFAALNLPLIPPQDRTVERLAHYIRRQPP